MLGPLTYIVEFLELGEVSGTQGSPHAPGERVVEVVNVDLDAATNEEVLVVDHARVAREMAAGFALVFRDFQVGERVVPSERGHPFMLLTAGAAREGRQAHWSG